MSARPPLTAQGNYEPGALLAYLEDARRRNMTPFDIARSLGISMDRYFYMIGGGRSVIFKSVEPSE